MCFFFFKQKTAYEMRISDWSSYVCSSDLLNGKNININSVFFKKGDIISFTDLIKKNIKMEMLQLKTIQNYNKKFLIFQEKFSFFLPYFIEVNWDTLEIICLKNATDLDINHMLHMYPKNLNISQLKNYLRLL